MSTSIAAAKKRRAPASAQVPTAPFPGQQPGAGVTSSSQPQGLTLPQVISLVDKRLLALETTVKSIRESSPAGETAAQVPSNITEVLDEINGRFEQFAEEIDNLKNIVLSLQSYTMDVNKMLLDERAQLIGRTTYEDESAQSILRTPVMNLRSGVLTNLTESANEHSSHIATF